MARMHRVVSTALALITLAFASSARADAVRGSVEAGNRAFIQAFLRGDSAAIANLYSEDARVIPPGSAAVSGRSAIAAFWKQSIESGIKDVALETVEVESAGGLAYETGTARLVGKDGATMQSRYVVVWKRVGDRWLLHRDIWNSQ